MSNWLENPNHVVNHRNGYWLREAIRYRLRERESEDTEDEPESSAKRDEELPKGKEPPQPKFQAGEIIETTSALRIRNGPGTDYPIEATAPEAKKGVIVDGPERADTYIWWKIEYDAGYTGWSAQPWLRQEQASSSQDLTDQESLSGQELRLIDYEDGYVVFNRVVEREEVIEYLWGDNYRPREDELWTKMSGSGGELGLFEDVGDHWKLKEVFGFLGTGQYYSKMLPGRLKQIKRLKVSAAEEKKEKKKKLSAPSALNYAEGYLEKELGAGIRGTAEIVTNMWTPTKYGGSQNDP